MSVLLAKRCILIVCLACAIGAPASAASAPLPAYCPNGVVRMGVEPGESIAIITPVFNQIGDQIAKNLGCPVKVLITENYTSEIEAMRAGRLEFGEFGPFGYILAHQVANAQAFATRADANHKPITYYASIVAPKPTDMKTLRDVAGHTFAYSDPASTSGHLLPAYALKKAGIDPDTGVKAFYAGSHTASFEALRNHKVQAGELNSSIMRVAGGTGEYKADDYVTLWTSDPIPGDAIAVRGDLPADFKRRLAAAVMAVDLSTVDDPYHVINGKTWVPQSDAVYDIIRDVASTLHVDLSAMH